MPDALSVETDSLRSTTRLSPMQVPKASDVLANELRERILRGDFVEGTPLPPERELVAQTQMSRTTVREALRILEVQGLVQIRTGRTGGAFVQRPGQDSIASTVNLLIRGRNVRLAALLETREAVEPACARLAAKYRTAADLEALDAANVAIAAEGSLADFLKANIDWHVAVAVASHNELLTGFMVALSRAIYASTDNQGFVDAPVRKTTVSAHESVTRAIRDGDPEAAVRRMSRHVQEYAEAVLAVEERTAIDVSDE
ncbi:FadR family transcriptional regulator [Nocardioides seonyuensis]|uniref:FadR family transcriptional regulator n=2 Tax=Nocardioides seonyuensis TaxID=2518371 RepID=A0A4P7IFB5_9ACTN|nr:FadR family transcriptional regulator [Nocardioides seonyuensis]